MPASRSRRSSVDGDHCRAPRRSRVKKGEPKAFRTGRLRSARRRHRALPHGVPFAFSGTANARTDANELPRTVRAWPISNLLARLSHSLSVSPCLFANVRIERPLPYTLGEYRSADEARRNSKKRYRCSAGVKRERKILRDRPEQEFYSLEFALPGTGYAGIPDTTASGADLTFATSLVANSKSECQIQTPLET